jgi:hypothetical protein
VSVTDILCGGFQANQPTKSPVFRQHVTMLVLTWEMYTKKLLVKTLPLSNNFVTGKYKQSRMLSTRESKLHFLDYISWHIWYLFIKADLYLALTECCFPCYSKNLKIYRAYILIFNLLLFYYVLFLKKLHFTCSILLKKNSLFTDWQIENMVNYVYVLFAFKYFVRLRILHYHWKRIKNSLLTENYLFVEMQLIIFD